ncbi:MAG: MarR family transcriptional regulator [Phycisphaerales bacterium]|nr:MarR family transcriptional regulator [Planctomycetota bacterium]
MGSCRIPKPSDPAAAARAEVVELLFVYVERLRTHFETVAQAHDLTPVQARVLLTLNEPLPMGTIADSLCCDPSNVTGVVARLQERGLLIRAASPKDRRIKHLRLTPEGLRLRSTFERTLFLNVPGMKTFTRAQLAEIKECLAMMSEGGPSTPPRPRKKTRRKARVAAPA